MSVPLSPFVTLAIAPLASELIYDSWAELRVRTTCWLLIGGFASPKIIQIETNTGSIFITGMMRAMTEYSKAFLLRYLLLVMTT
jgi:hypothetical protein